MLFKTESGSIYEIKDSKIRRINYSDPKRGDNEWVQLRETPDVRLGRRVILVMDSLEEYGPTDFEDTLQRDLNTVTTRVTTEVKWIGNTHQH